MKIIAGSDSFLLKLRQKSADLRKIPFILNGSIDSVPGGSVKVLRKTGKHRKKTTGQQHVLTHKQVFNGMRQ